MNAETPLSTFQGFTVPERNYFHLPNEWIDICAQIDNLAELKVIQYILRHTWGYHEYNLMKTITTDEFMHGRRRKNGSRLDKGTGLSNRSVIDGLRRAIEHGFLVCTVDDTDKARTVKSYALRMTPTPSPMKDLHTTYVDPSHHLCRSFTPPMKDLHTTYVDSSDRSEKDTSERHFKKDTSEVAATDASQNSNSEVSKAADAAHILSLLKNLPEGERQQLLSLFLQPTLLETLPKNAEQELQQELENRGIKLEVHMTRESDEDNTVEAEAHREPEKSPAILQKSAPDTPRTAEAVVELLEFLRGEHYTGEVRPRELRAAQKLLGFKPAYTLAEIEESWRHGSDEYWLSKHNGEHVHVHDLVNQNSHGVYRIQAFLEHKRAQDRKAYRPRQQQENPPSTPPVQQQLTMDEVNAQQLAQLIQQDAVSGGHEELSASVRQEGTGWIVSVSWRSFAWKGDLGLEIRSVDQWQREFAEWTDMMQLRAKRKGA